MWRAIKKALALFIGLTMITGWIYPLCMTGLAQILFPSQANGSLIYKNSSPIGSRMIGQNFSNPAYFQGRPSVAGQDGYDAASSAGSNLGPTNAKFIDGVKKAVDKVRSSNGMSEEQAVPPDLVLASASGLDPDISLTAAYAQVTRVATERGLQVNDMYKLVDNHVTGRQLGILGEERVNVLELNIALDQLK